MMLEALQKTMLGGSGAVGGSLTVIAVFGLMTLTASIVSVHYRRV